MNPTFYLAATLAYFGTALLFYGVVTYIDVRRGVTETPGPSALQAAFWPVIVAIVLLAVVLLLPFRVVRHLARELAKKHLRAAR